MSRSRIELNSQAVLNLDVTLDIGDTRGLLARLRRYVAYRLGRNEPESNTLIATKPIPIDQGAESFSAELQADVGWRASDNGQTLSLLLRVRNTGRSFWPAGGTAKGVVTLGPYVPQPGGERHPAQRAAGLVVLPHALAPGEELQIELCVPRVSVGDSREVAVDCVREGIAWFADMGSAPLVAAVE